MDVAGQGPAGAFLLGFSFGGRAEVTPRNSWIINESGQRASGPLS